MQSEFNQGATYARDCIIANIICIQNGIIHKMESEEYKTLQALLMSIEDTYGKYMQDFKR